ncbi:GAF domain-containing protein [Pseudonocardia petroleophila]|uniref:GAF and ANTAR domain-containing protein n=1 Tax=Pseudonocardia petroleophila TaxID=37331 RepID=A0A7G7MH18_9PSEU|nr:GAF and ANTAR domain-containing protein [Pseudonocardia petroleophila]QNG52079.1 GAF and ANTAR domain-containing protein [Pseudonocardia petroleophila]
MTRALLAIARDGLDDHALAERICRACVDGLDVDGAAISLFTTSSARETLWATDATAALLEDLQFTLNEGACMEAATTGLPVFVADLGHSTEAARWPVFAGAVAEQAPVGALFALPLHWGAINLGVLDLYRTTPGELDETQRRDALAAADTATLMLLGQRTDPAPDRPGHDTGWVHHNGGGPRAEIHQATGMVLAQLDVSATNALARLRAHAYRHRRPLLDVARDVVDRTLVFTEDMN